MGADPSRWRDVVVAGPHTSGINDLISGLDYAFPAMAKLGGIAGNHSANHGSLLLGDQVHHSAVGCVISGAWTLEPLSRVAAPLDRSLRSSKPSAMWCWSCARTTWPAR